VNAERMSDRPRLPDPKIEARKAAAGRLGFILGCIVAIIGFAVNAYRAPRPFGWISMLTLALIAALNVPLGIGLALLAEKATRSRGDGPPKRRR
jgi:hypothetical protein